MQRQCHTCGESSDEVIGCANAAFTLANGAPACTKIICRACFYEYGWDWQAAWSARWECTHCRGVCPRCVMVAPPIPTKGDKLGFQLAHVLHMHRRRDLLNAPLEVWRPFPSRLQKAVERVILFLVLHHRDLYAVSAI